MLGDAIITSYAIELNTVRAGLLGITVDFLKFMNSCLN